MTLRPLFLTCLFVPLALLLGACGTKESPRPGASQPKPSPRVAVKKPSVRIVLDPGHGGESAGAIAPAAVSGGYERRVLMEKEVVLSISLDLARLIRERLGYEVLLTRAADKTVPLETRTETANSAEGTIFLSIHANASEGHKRRGVEVYYLDNTDDEASLKLAQRENGRPASTEEQDLSFILSDVIQTAKMEESITLAHYLYDALLAKLRMKYARVKGNGVMKAPFSVLVGAHMPSVLVEVSYIDHPEEGKRLGSTAYQLAVAEGLFEGVRRYLEKMGY